MLRDICICRKYCYRIGNWPWSAAAPAPAESGMRMEQEQLYLYLHKVEEVGGVMCLCWGNAACVTQLIR